MCLMLFFDTARIVCMQQGGLCNGTHLSLSVCLSVPFARCSGVQPVYCCGPMWTGDIDRSQWPLDAAAARHSAANAGSVITTAKGRG